MVNAQGGSVDSAMFQVGEELIYNVSYAFIDIGQIRVRVLDKVTIDSSAYYRTIVYVDSYEGVPLVDFHSIFESNINPALFSIHFRSREKEEENRWFSTAYNFEYKRKKVLITKGYWGSSRIEGRDSLSLDTLSQDGLSLFYYARGHALDGQKQRVPVIVKEKKVFTTFNFYNKRTNVEINALKYPVDVVEFDGNAEFVGVFGLTGYFQGWFSNDATRVPIVAKMKVLIGNIRVELVKWKRAGWEPPKYVEGSLK